MDKTLPQKFHFILDRNLAKANSTGNHVCTSCDKVVLSPNRYELYRYDTLSSLEIEDVPVEYMVEYII